MRIQRLELINFRNFEQTIFDFPERFTVLVGDNGTGKTAILDAITISVSCLFCKFDNFKHLERKFSDDDVRQVRYKKGQTPTIEPQYPVVFDCTAVVDGAKIAWTRQSRLVDRIVEIGKTNLQVEQTVTPYIVKLSEQIQEKVRRGEDILLPLIAYYGTGRLWLQNTEESVETIKPGSRMLGYVNCLDPTSNSNVLMRWLKTMEIAALQRGESILVLDAVKTAIANCLEDCQSVRYDILEDELITTFNDERILPFRMLSDGFRNMFGMVADIAYRAAVLNPQLGRDAAQQTPGIVLIDEIDLHLHPKWQRRVVDDLKKTFPNIQFVATTHSPFIIQSLREGELINLDKPTATEEYENKSIEDITEYVMGVDIPQRSERYQKMMEAAQEYYRVLQDAKDAHPERIEELKTKLDELTMPYSDDPAYHAFLKMEREAAGLGRDKQ